MLRGRPRFARCAAAFASALLLAACAGTGEWVKPGADEAATAQASRDCRAQARAVFARDRQVDQDILATRERDWQAAGTLQGQRETMFNQARGHADAAFAACMRQKGFTRPH